MLTSLLLSFLVLRVTPSPLIAQYHSNLFFWIGSKEAEFKKNDHSSFSQSKPGEGKNELEDNPLTSSKSNLSGVDGVAQKTNNIKEVGSLKLSGHRDSAHNETLYFSSNSSAKNQKKASNIFFLVALTILALSFVLLHATLTFSCLQGGNKASLFNGLFVIDQTSLLAVTITSLIIIWYVSVGLINQDNDELVLPNLGLIIIMVIAMISIATSNDVLSLIVAVETQSLALYILVALPASQTLVFFSGSAHFKQDPEKMIFLSSPKLNREEVIKNKRATKPARAKLGLLYLLNASVATAVLLIGLSSDLNLLIVIGLLWKLGAWPVHAWLMPLTDALDKYTATLLLTVTKLGLIVYLSYLATGKKYILYIGIGNLLIGSIIALMQQRYIRLFAWLSLTQLGYVLLAISFNQTANALLYFMLYCTFTALLLLINDMPTLTLANSYKQIGLGLLLAYTINLYATAGLPSAPIFWIKLELLLLANSQAIALALIATLISSLVYVKLIRYASFYSYALH